MSNSTSTSTESPQRRRFSIGRIALVGVGFILLALMVLVIWNPPLIQVDREPRGPVIRNETADIVIVFTVEPGGTTETRRLFVPAGDSRELFGNCRDELVARDEEGKLLGRRGPFEECNLDRWVIGS